MAALGMTPMGREARPLLGFKNFGAAATPGARGLETFGPRVASRSDQALSDLRRQRKESLLRQNAGRRTAEQTRKQQIAGTRRTIGISGEAAEKRRRGGV